MSNEIENRVRILEEKHEYQDRTVEELNQVVIDQQAQLTEFKLELAKLREDVMSANIDTEDISDVPPHY
ncbi:MULTISPECIES: SlyX family protein [Desulfosediminicola]|uniref:SlyX family protein n=1 Tax=Desulfosediminicola TaxID=2886823 RepID=UPI0010ABDB86|nr:SlyX family protein [Desulfosediminicola ganghwensis]